MKAIVIRQPWATLVSLGIKTIETRPGPPNGPMRPDGVRALPGCTLERGERVAIVAGAVVPPRGDCCGDWSVESWRDGSCSPCAVHLGAPSITSGYRSPVDLPLSAVVCTVTVDDALCVRLERDIGEPIPPNGCLAVTPPELPHPSLTRIEWKRNAWTGAPAAYCELATDGIAPTTHGQLPLGDFTPGRWGWLLGDVQPCVPVPCKGRQGVFVLPDDVAEGVR